jgi:hypothetical protein
MNDAAAARTHSTIPAPPESGEQTALAALDAEMARLNAIGLYRQALVDIAAKNREIASLKHAMITVETVLPLALAADTALADELVRVLATARGAR